MEQGRKVKDHRASLGRTQTAYADRARIFSKQWIGIDMGITVDVFKIRARVTGAEHQDMLHLTDGYMTAWMLYHLQGDEEAAGVFVGDNAEILTNNGWQDIEKNK